MKRELLIEMAQIAVRSIRGNRLRTGLTIGIIGLGIMALISMTTATSSLEANVVEQFSSSARTFSPSRRKPRPA